MSSGHLALPVGMFGPSRLLDSQGHCPLTVPRYAMSMRGASEGPRHLTTAYCGPYPLHLTCPHTWGSGQHSPAETRPHFLHSFSA